MGRRILREERQCGMKIEIDRNKCGAEYSLCPQCRFEKENDYDKCGSCTMVVDVGYSFLLCGIPIGSGITHLHKNFEPKEKGKV